MHAHLPDPLVDELRAVAAVDANYSALTWRRKRDIFFATAAFSLFQHFRHQFNGRYDIWTAIRRVKDIAVRQGWHPSGVYQSATADFYQQT
jgi:hypothetical protein